MNANYTIVDRIEDLLGSEGTPSLAAAVYAVVDKERVLLHDADEGSYSEAEWNTLVDQAQAGIEAQASIDKAVAAIGAAQSAFVHADWMHERIQNGRIVLDEDDEPVYCDGTCETCETCVEATSAAQAASDLGDEAIEAIQRGDLEEGLRLVLRARELEDEWGDSPAWTPAVEAVEAAIRDGE